MRSLLSTIILALACTVLGALALMQWQFGGFELLLGKPPAAVGTPLYSDFKAEEVTRIAINTATVRAVFERGPSGWTATRPWQDRMDPMAADAIIRFSLTMRVEDLADKEEIDPAVSGLDDRAIEIRLRNAEGRKIAAYRLGRISPWKTEIEGQSQPINTLFVETEDKGRGGHVYLCSGDITPMFQDGLKLLRDHRPFYFNPLLLEKIAIRSPQGELTLGRDHPSKAWRIVKPLELPTDTRAMQSLLEGLYKLHGSRLRNRDEVTLPSNTSSAKSIQISIQHFGVKQPVTLEIFPAESPDQHSLMAMVSDRPNTVFDLPLKPTPGLISIADLPMDVNALRDPALSHINSAALREIAIIPSTGAPILLTCEPPQPWMAHVNGRSYPANKDHLDRLLKAVTEQRAEGFESDAATDFSPWGLDRPILRLGFKGSTAEVLELRIGMNKEGEFFATRHGTSTVMRIDPLLVRSIAILPHEWMHSQVWSISRHRFRELSLKDAGGNEIHLSYNDLSEKWTDREGRPEINVRINQERAGQFLTLLENLRSQLWLAQGDVEALSALAHPDLTVSITEVTTDGEGRNTGATKRTLLIAPADAAGHPQQSFGLISGHPHPFLFDSANIRQFARGILDP